MPCLHSLKWIVRSGLDRRVQRSGSYCCCAGKNWGAQETLVASRMRKVSAACLRILRHRPGPGGPGSQVLKRSCRQEMADFQQTAKLQRKQIGVQ